MSVGAILVVLMALSIWMWSRPVSLRVLATPDDATIVLAGSKPAVGSLTIRDAKPGRHRATIARTGFATRTVTVKVRHFRDTEQRIVLKPLPQRLTVTAEPEGASITVMSAGKKAAGGVGSVSATLPAGAVTVKVTAPGRNAFARELFLDRATDLNVILDPEGQLAHMRSIITCAGAPKGVVITPDGKQAWATLLDGPPSIEILDLSSGKRVGGIDLGKFGAVEIVFSKNGSRAYASQMETAKVFEIDTATRKVLRSFGTGSTWTKVIALSPDEKTLYAANWSGDDVSVIDLVTGELDRRIPVADTPRGLWPTSDGKSLYVASFGEGVLERIDLETGKVSEVFDGGSALRHLIADEKRGILFASDMGDDCVWATDLTTGKTEKFTTVGHKPNTIDLSPEGDVLFVSNRGENNAKSYYLPGPEWGSIMLFDAKTGEPLDGIVGGNQCTALDVSDDGRTLVFSDFLDDRLRVYEIPDSSVLAKGGGGRFATLAQDVMK